MAEMLSTRSVLAAKAETTPGTAVALSASEAAFNVFDLVMNPTVEFTENPGQGGFSHRTGTLGARMGRCTFRMQLRGGSSIPPWAALFLPACGFVETATVFSPVSKPPSVSGVTSLTLGQYVDGTKKLMRGCAGNARFEFEAGKPVNIFYDFIGIWGSDTDVPVSDTSILAPDYPADSVLRFASSAISIGGSYTPRVGRLTLDLGNQVIMVPDSADISGYKHAMITARRVNGSMDPESTLVATRAWQDIWLALTEASLAWTLGSGSNEVQFSMPAMQQRNVQQGERDRVLIEQVEFQANRSADAGDDELTITIPAS